MGAAEVTRDEFGGYCTKRWGTSAPCPSRDLHEDDALMGFTDASTMANEDSLCKQLGLDIDRKAKELVVLDF